MKYFLCLLLLFSTNVYAYQFLSNLGWKVHSVSSSKTGTDCLIQQIEALNQAIINQACKLPKEFKQIEVFGEIGKNVRPSATFLIPIGGKIYKDPMGSTIGLRIKYTREVNIKGQYKVDYKAITKDIKNEVKAATIYKFTDKMEWIDFFKQIKGSVTYPKLITYCEIVPDKELSKIIGDACDAVDKIYGEVLQ